MGIGLLHPLPNHRISQPFGPSSLTVEPEGWLQRDDHGPLRFRRTPFANARYREDIHTGEDVSAPDGTAVMAPQTGLILLGRVDPATGDRYIRILVRPGTVLQLDHFSRILVPEGVRVIRGQRIGLSGHSGDVTGPHLHWEVRHYVGLNPRPDPAACSAWYRYNPARCVVGGDLAGRSWLNPA